MLDALIGNEIFDHQGMKAYSLFMMHGMIMSVLSALF